MREPSAGGPQRSVHRRVPWRHMGQRCASVRRAQPARCAIRLLFPHMLYWVRGLSAKRQERLLWRRISFFLAKLRWRQMLRQIYWARQSHSNVAAVSDCWVPPYHPQRSGLSEQRNIPILLLTTAFCGLGEGLLLHSGRPLDCQTEWKLCPIIYTELWQLLTISPCKRLSC